MLKLQKLRYSGGGDKKNLSPKNLVYKKFEIGNIEISTSVNEILNEFNPQTSIIFFGFGINDKFGKLK